jgi:hypothetical protein
MIFFIVYWPAIIIPPSSPVQPAAARSGFSSPLAELEDAFYNIGFTFNKLSIDIGCGCITAPSLNLSRPV